MKQGAEKTIPEMQQKAVGSEVPLSREHVPRLQTLVRSIFTEEFRSRELIGSDDVLPEVREHHWNVVPDIDGESSVHGSANNYGHVRLLDKVSLSRAIAIAIHEMVHVYADSIYTQRAGGTYRATSGYKTSTTLRQGRESDSFRGFNEAVVHSLTIELLKKHRDAIAKEFPEASIDSIIKSSEDYYRIDREILDAVATLVAKHNLWNSGTTITAKSYKERLFTAQFQERSERELLMKNAEHALPPGGMKILAALGRRSLLTRSRETRLEEYQLFREFIQPHTTSERRDRIAQEILPNEHQLYRYYMTAQWDAIPVRLNRLEAEIRTLRTFSEQNNVSREVIASLKNQLELERMRCSDIAKATREHMKNYFQARARKWSDQLRALGASGDTEGREGLVDTIFSKAWTMHQYDAIFPDMQRLDDDTSRYFFGSLSHLPIGERRQMTMLYEAAEHSYPIMRTLSAHRVRINALSAEVSTLER